MHKIENDSRKKCYSSPAPIWTDWFSDLQALRYLYPNVATLGFIQILPILLV
jgi:hypothetical protein